MWWVLSIILAIVLLAIGYQEHKADLIKMDLTCANSNKTYDRNEKKTSKRKGSGYFQSSTFRKLILDVGITVLGVILAIGPTLIYQNIQTRQRLFNSFRVAAKDIQNQSILLGEIIDVLQNDVESLRLNASIDLFLMDSVIYDDDVKDKLEDGPYSMLLNNYRSIKQYSSYLASGRPASDSYIVAICNMLHTHMQ